jgi:GT2 family glycosyltransferase
MIQCNYDTAVVILSYNGKKWHDLFLPKIIEQAKDQYQVIVVDNASTDDTLLHVQTYYPSVTTLHLPINRGFANGYYEALQQIAATYYILLSADFEVTDNWFSPIHDKMLSDPQIAVCQPKIRYWKERSYFEYAGAAGGYMDYLGYLFCRGRIFETLEEDHHQYDDAVELFWASGGCFVVNAAVYHHVGGLDRDLYAHMEEVDLCWRIKNAGYKIAYVPNATVYHVGGSVISYGSTQKLFYNFRNSLILLLKNERSAKLCWLLPVRLVLDGVAGLQLLLQGKWKHTLTIVKAHFSFYGQLGLWLKKRAKNKALITQRNTVGIYQKSIIWQYFAKKKRTFSALDFKTKAI